MNKTYPVLGNLVEETDNTPINTYVFDTHLAFCIITDNNKKWSRVKGSRMMEDGEHFIRWSQHTESSTRYLLFFLTEQKQKK